MTRKKRIFDIAMPDEAAETPAPPAGGHRRGPMASAIAENAEALQARKSAAEAIRDENDALAHEFVALKRAGHVVQSLPLDDVQSRMLVRDRIPGEDDELAELAISIRDVGLSNPIRVFPRPDGTGFELVQGYRRLCAYRRLLEQTGQALWKRIPALVLPGEADISGLYRRMVDENVIRKDLSFAEMAFAAQNFADDPATDAKDLREAVATLFQSAPYSKRNYIRSFAQLLQDLEGVLQYPTGIPRALGVTLAREIRDNPELADQLRTALMENPDRSAEDELEVLRSFAEVSGPNGDGAAAQPAQKPKKAGQGARTKTTFHIESSAGQVKCTAAQGRLEIKADRDFSAIERARLEGAIASLIDGLG